MSAKHKDMRDVSVHLDKISDIVTDEIERSKVKGDQPLMVEILDLLINVQEARKKVAEIIKSRMPHT